MPTNIWGLSAGCYKTLIINSEGTHCEDVSTYFSGFIAVNVPDGVGVSTASESDSSRKLDIDPEKIANKACEIALNSRGGKSVETGDMKVLLDHHAASGLLSTFSQAINGDNVQRGRSIYADRMEKEVSSPHLTYTMMEPSREVLTLLVVMERGHPARKRLS